MGDTLSNSVKVLLDKLVSNEFINDFRRMKLDDSLLKSLTKTLLMVLIAKIKYQDGDMLRYAVLEVENMYEEINTEALRCKVEEYETLTPTSSPQVSNLISTQFINSKLQKLIERLEFLTSGTLGVSNSSSVWYETPKSSDVVDESCIYGRDNDINKLKMMLLSEDANDHVGDCKLRIISIVGMGGIGKTALAKLLYSDSQVKDKFGVRGWIHVSKDFVVFRVLETILKSIRLDLDDIDRNETSD